MHKCLTVVGFTIVVNATEFKDVSVDELPAVMDIIHGYERRVFVENSRLFFSESSFLAKLKDGNDQYLVIAEHLGINLTVSDRVVLRDYDVLMSKIKALIELNKPPYPFTKVPEDFDVLSYFRIDKACVRRRGDLGYQISLKMAERVWKHASKIWQGDHQPSLVISASGYSSRQIGANATDLKIGCQTIPRHAVEQLALHLGWEFPAKK